MAIPMLLTEDQAAELIHVSPRTLRALRSQGKIRYVRPSPHKVRYRADDLEEYIASQTRQDNPPCPSTNQRKAASGTSISGSKVSAITEALAARRNAMRNDSKPKNGGRRL